MKRSFKTTLTCAALVMGTALTAGASVPQREFRVVIDPGHGGGDFGTVFDDGRRKLAEKNITLVLAEEAARQLRARGIRAILTRGNDRDVPLPARTALANRLEADVFLSVHMNSTPTPMVSDAQGIETYILNNATDASSRRLARLENSVLGKSADESPEDLDVALILKDLRLDGNLSESKRLACSIQTSLIGGSADPQRNRGVKQALFHVLLGADMPSALLEVGFLNNPRDRARVLSPSGRKAIGHSIATAIEQFRSTKGSRRALSELARCKVSEHL